MNTMKISSSERAQELLEQLKDSKDNYKLETVNGLVSTSSYLDAVHIFVNGPSVYALIREVEGDDSINGELIAYKPTPFPSDLRPLVQTVDRMFRMVKHLSDGEAANFRLKVGQNARSLANFYRQCPELMDDFRKDVMSELRDYESMALGLKINEVPGRAGELSARIMNHIGQYTEREEIYDGRILCEEYALKWMVDQSPVL